MGGNTPGPSQTTTTNQQQTQQTTPYGPASPYINNIIGQIGSNPGYNDITAAADAFRRVGLAGNRFQGAQNAAANYALSGGPDRSGIINDAYLKYIRATDPYASGEYLDPSKNGALQKYLQVARDDISNNIRQQFAGAGRDLSGLENQNVARGIMQAEAPILYDAYNQAQAQRVGAIQGQFGAASALTGQQSALDQAKAALMAQGFSEADAANMAQLYGGNVLQAAGSLPLSYLGNQAGILGSLGAQFGTTTGTGTGTQNTQSYMPTWMPVVGGILGGAGIASKFLPVGK